jgi:hypothetical protein
MLIAELSIAMSWQPKEVHSQSIDLDRICYAALIISLLQLKTLHNNLDSISTLIISSI